MIFLDRSDSFFFFFPSYSKGVKAKPRGPAFRESQAFRAFASGGLRDSDVFCRARCQNNVFCSVKTRIPSEKKPASLQSWQGRISSKKKFLSVAVNMFIWFYLQIHSLTFQWERNPGDADHIRYLKSLNTWSQPCGPKVSEEEREKKRMSQREEKQKQDQESLGRRNRREGHNSVQWNSERRLWGLAVRAACYSGENHVCGMAGATHYGTRGMEW